MGLAELSALLPSHVDSVNAWKSWRERSMVAIAKGGQPTLLSDDSKSRLRWKPGILEMFKGMSQEQATAWSGYWKVLPAADRRYLWNTLSPTGVFRCGDAKVVALVLKELSDLSKKHRDALFGRLWKTFVDLHLLRDYMPVVPIEEFRTDLIDWCQGKVVHETKEGDFMPLFRQGVREFLRLGPGSEPEPTTNLEWLQDPENWARSGTSDEDRLYVIDGSKVRKARKSKWATALATTPDKLLRMLLGRTKQHNKAVQKRELGKVRAVIAGDLPTYLKMARVSRWLEAKMKGHPFSTLFYSHEQALELWTAMGEQTRSGRFVCMPIDQAKFDHMVSLEMVLCTVEEIKNYIFDECTTSEKEELLELMDLIRYALDGGVTSVGEFRILIEKGVMSGWRWTALLDTIINYAENYVARIVVMRESGEDPMITGVYQGDDVRAVVKSYTAATALWAAYNDMGFIVNPGKFFIARDCDEFLRQVAFQGVVTGYPARAVPAMIFRNPVSRGLNPGEERIREMLNSWNTVFARAGKAKWELAVKDIAAANRLSEDVVWRLLFTPACVGGMGLTQDAPREGVGVSKSVHSAIWSYSRPPPLALHLADLFPHLCTVGKLESYWHDNVEAPPGTLFTDKAFEIKNVLVPPLILGDWSPSRGRGMPMSPMVNRKLAPSVAGVLLETIVRDKEWDKIWEYVDAQHWAVTEWMWGHSSRRVFVDWLMGRLPFKTPTVPLWSAVAVSAIYQSWVSTAWSWVVSKSKVTFPNLMRAARTAEWYTHRTLLTSGSTVIRVGG